MDRSLPANAGYGLTWSDRIQSRASGVNEAAVPQLLSPRSRACAPAQEEPPQQEARAPQWIVAPTRATRESPGKAAKTWCSPKYMN